MILVASLCLNAEEPASEEEETAGKAQGEEVSKVVKVERTEPPEVLQGPTVVLRASEKRMVYEFRVNGRLTRIKVIPKNGRPYYLVPTNRAETMGEFRQNSRLVPIYEIITF